MALPPEVPESSGLAPVSGVPGAFWTHNDSGWPAELFAVSATGELLARVRVRGAENVDWEEIAALPCPDGSPCLLIADTGDNLERRDDPALYRIREPALDPARTRPAPGPRDEGVPVLEAGPAERFPLRLSDGPRDVEAVVPLPGGRVVLSSEAGPGRRQGQLSRLRCAVPGAEW